MLDSIWQLLANYGLDTGEIADGISSLFTVTETTDAEGNVVTEYGGTLGALADFPSSVWFFRHLQASLPLLKKQSPKLSYIH